MFLALQEMPLLVDDLVPKAIAAGAEVAVPAASAIDCKAAASVKESFAKYVEGVHAKSSTLCTWISNLEQAAGPSPSARAQLPGCRFRGGSCVPEVSERMPRCHAGLREVFRGHGGVPAQLGAFGSR